MEKIGRRCMNSWHLEESLLIHFAIRSFERVASIFSDVDSRIDLAEQRLLEQELVDSRCNDSDY